MNEELQSTNDQLQATNEELRARGEALDYAKSFLESILSSMPEGVIVLDPEFRVLAWNRKSEDLWGLRADEVRGTHFLNLDIGLPVAQLAPHIRTALSESRATTVTVTATNRRGKPVDVRVVCSRLVKVGMSGVDGVLVLASPRPSRIDEEAVGHTRALLQNSPSGVKEER